MNAMHEVGRKMAARGGPGSRMAVMGAAVADVEAGRRRPNLVAVRFSAHVVKVNVRTDGELVKAFYGPSAEVDAAAFIVARGNVKPLDAHDGELASVGWQYL
jgi:hypothetical protein